MKNKLLIIVASIILISLRLSAQNSSEIIFASSFYKTASGAIGPSHVVASNTYRIKIKGFEDIVIDSIIIGQRKIVCEPVTLQSQNNIIDFTLSIAIHQNKGIWYTGRIMPNDGATYRCEVQALPNNKPRTESALIIYGHNGQSSFKLIKEKFDQEHSQYNK